MYHRVALLLALAAAWWMMHTPSTAHTDAKNINVVHLTHLMANIYARVAVVERHTDAFREDCNLDALHTTVARLQAHVTHLEERLEHERAVMQAVAAQLDARLDDDAARLEAYIGRREAHLRAHIARLEARMDGQKEVVLPTQQYYGTAVLGVVALFVLLPRLLPAM